MQLEAEDELVVALYDELGMLPTVKAVWSALTQKPRVVLHKANSTNDIFDTIAGVTPHLVMFNVAKPDGTVLDLLRSVRQARSELPILILTPCREVQVAIEALSAGANGYCLTHSSELFAEAMLAVSCGAAWLDPHLAIDLLH